MGIVAHDAFCLGIMRRRINAGDFCPGAVFVREIGMAADTKPAAPVDSHARRILRMVEVRSMTVLTTDSSMGGALDIVIFVFVTFSADSSSLVLDRNFLPFSFIGFAVPAIHVAAFLYAKIIRH